MTRELPRRINQGWIDQAKTRLSCTRKTLEDGAPNPAYLTASQELEAAMAEKAACAAFDAWVLGKYGARPNQYEVREAGQTYKPGQIFVRKDATTGRLVTVCRTVAWSFYLAETGE